MDFLILGPIEVRNGSGRLPVSGKPLAVLAVLLLHPNEPVSVDRLALAVWGEDAPGRSVKTVQVNVSRLRDALGDPGVVTTTPAGYSLRVRHGELDAERFEGLVEDARRGLADGQPETAAATLREALELWRGPALAELSHEPFAGAEIARLEEQRLTALELRLGAELAAGRHAEVVGELGRLVHSNPTREELAGQHMLALYRCGRQSEALEAYATTRRRLVDDLGIEPGPQLRELHEAILRQDVALDPKPAETGLPAALDPTSAQPLVGRDRELAWLRSHWEQVRAGGGSVVALAGPRGIGKSRLVAELAQLVHGPGVAILHASGDGPADTILVALRRAREATRPTLLVVDDADRAGAGVHGELEKLAHELTGVPALVVACTDRPPEFAPATLEIQPLDAAAVRTIAARYVPGRAAADVPAESLLELSGGVPRRVHEAAGQWARREAARHVEVLADRARAGRAELVSIEDELAGGIAEAQQVRQRIVTGRRKDTPVVCPFKGLAAFEVADERWFFGRAALVNRLAAALAAPGLLGIVGPSGSGKSSVLRAGLLPELAHGLMGSASWKPAILRPGRQPMGELAAALAATDDAEHVVLAVDQFEEVFTACDDEAERSEFISELVQAARHPDGRYRVVVAVRADQYGRCAQYPELAALLARNHVLVGAMGRTELRQVIEGPCDYAGLQIERELVDALVDDVEREPGGLPLLSTALLELWQRRDGRHLRLSAYEHSGGVHGAVARLAEDAFAQLDESQQALARSVLMRLVGSGDGDAVERRRVALDSLEIDRSEELARVVALLTDRRLLTVDAGSVELAHEALMREWPRLRGWIEEDRDGLRIQRGVGSAAEEWERLGRDEGALLRGSRLSEAVEWRDEREPRLNELEREFLAAGEAARERERTTRRRRARLVMGAAGTVIVAVVAVTVAALFAGRERAISQSRDLATKATALTTVDPGVGFALAREALERRDTPQAQNALRQTTLLHRATALTQATEGKAYVAEPSPDGRTIVSSDEEGRVRLWRAGSLQPQRTLAVHRSPAVWAAFSPDGKDVASVAFDGEIALTPVAGGPKRTLQRLAGEKEYATTVDVASGVVVVTTSAGAVRMLPTAPGAKPYVLGRHDTPYLTTVAVNANATKVVSGAEEEPARLWDVSSRTATVLDIPGVTWGVSFSPDGTRFATGDADGHLRLWATATGERIGQPIELSDQPLATVRFSPDGRRIVTSGDDGVVRIVDVGSRRIMAEMPGGSAWFAAFVPHAGGAVVSAGRDGTLRAWAPLEVRTARDAGTVPSYNPAGTQIVSGDEDGAVHLWDLAKGERTLSSHGDASVAAFSPDGSRVASVSQDGTGRVHDLRAATTRDIVFDEFDYPKNAVAVDGAGRIAVGGVFDAPILVQRPDGSGRVELTGDDGAIIALAFSPDGRRLASASEDGTARIWNLETYARTRKAERVMRADVAAVRSVSWDRDGSRIATAGTDGTVRIWPVAGGEPVVLVGHEGPVNTAEFNRRGDRVVSTGLDGTVRVWDTSGGETLVVLYRHTGTGGGGADFSPDGRSVVSAGSDGMRITPCEVCGTFAEVRRLADDRLQPALAASDRLAGTG
jgi:WD40 repeat protein/DNA-binding SARP family transcriptional activator